MLEIIRTQSRALEINQVSQPACEVSQFMKNFFEATHEGNPEEISTYYADEMEPFSFPFNADWIDETLLVDDHLATFSCILRTSDSDEQRLTCVLDKSEGYWQIIHGEIRNESRRH